MNVAWRFKFEVLKHPNGIKQTLHSAYLGYKVAVILPFGSFVAPPALL